MNMVVEFFSSGWWLPFTLGTDDGKEIFFLRQIIQSVLIKAYQFGIDAAFLGFRCQIGGQLF